MSIIKFFFSKSRPQTQGDEGPQAPLARDPLSHPALAAMSMAELADLPLMPENLGRRTDGGNPVGDCCS